MADHPSESIRDKRIAFAILDTLLARAPIGFCFVDLELRLLSINSFLAAQVGADARELVGQPVSTILNGHHPQIRAAIQKTLLSGEPVVDTEICWQAGTATRLWSLSMYPVTWQDGATDGAGIIIRDITDTRLAVRKAEAERRQLFALLEELPAFVYLQDRDYHLPFVNRAFRTLFGEPRGRTCYELFHRLPEPCEVCAAAQVLESRQTRSWEWSGPDEQSYMIYNSLFQPPGEPAMVIGIGLNVTQQRKASVELNKVQRLESLGILAGGIAHDFNNLLSGLFGYIDLARDSLQSGALREAADNLAGAMSVFGRARGLTDQLLTFAKGGQPVRTITDLATLLKETTLFALSGSNVGPRLRIEADLWPAEVDVGQIGQVIDNLVINARQAMAGGGTVEVRARNLASGADLPQPLRPGDYIEITVQDAGPGIAEQHLPFIFDPFFTTKQGGSGLGLSTAYSIVKKHGGTITVESRPGEGSRFHIFLPALPGASLPRAKPDGLAARHSGRILLMDDESSMRQAVGEMLRKMGFRVEVATNGADALELYRDAKQQSKPFDLVILDLTVPGGMGGHETLRQLQRLDPAVKAIASSGYSDDPIMADPTRFGFSAKLPKPFRIAELQEVLLGLLP